MTDTEVTNFDFSELESLINEIQNEAVLKPNGPVQFSDLRDEVLRNRKFILRALFILRELALVRGGANANMVQTSI